jgi:hypothetical protein
MILEDYKLLFIHIPRTGGTSVEKFFEFKSHDNLLSGRPPTVYNGQHFTLSEYAEKINVEKYFKFTIVRNPWDRLLSWYLWSYADLIYFQYMSEKGQYVSTGKNNRMRAWLRGKNLLDEKNNNFTDQKFFLKFKTAFSAFIQKLEASSDLELDVQYDNLCKTENRLCGRWIMPQVRWLEMNNKINLDYVCKFEKLKNNFATVLKKNKIKNGPLEVLGCIYNKPTYRKFYTKKNQEIISRLYAEDIKKFKYEF